jgi:hypothetical protein
MTPSFVFLDDEVPGGVQPSTRIANRNCHSELGDIAAHLELRS